MENTVQGTQLTVSYNARGQMIFRLAGTRKRNPLPEGTEKARLRKYRATMARKESEYFDVKAEKLQRQLLAAVNKAKRQKHLSMAKHYHCTGDWGGYNRELDNARQYGTVTANMIERATYEEYRI